MDAIRVPKVTDVQIYRPGSGARARANGTVHLTAHHLIYTYSTSKSTSADGEADEEEMWVPYPLINQLTRLPQTLQGLSPLAFRTRTFEAFTLFFPRDTDATQVFDTVRELTVVASVTHLYAFFNEPDFPISPDGNNGWKLYDAQEEFTRMGVGARSKAWRFTEINNDYSFAPTYPAKLVVPARIGDATLTYAGKYRSKARIPTLSYLHWSNFGSITRCSQPLVGITQNRSIQDEKLVEAIFQSHLSAEPSKDSPMIYGATCTNVIIDARPTANAMANVAQGGGSENMDHYKGGTGTGFGVTKKAYLGIENIHVVRDSLNKVVEALREADGAAEPTLDGAAFLDATGADSLGLVDRHALRRSGWLRHLSSILQGTLIVVRTVHIASSHVLVHCSDGWDRTAQITALAQLCLDPYYRTIRGFMVLIEKEWCSFGHKFLDRCGHLSSERFFIGGSSAAERAAEAGDEGGGGGAGAFIAGFRDRISNPSHIKEMSPVFHQFLECVRNIQRQFPDRFEYNELFLRNIHRQLYACEYGTFLFNCERERKVSLDGASSWSGIQKTKSVWEWFLSEGNMKGDRWLNQTYNKSLDDVKNGAGDMGVLIPSAKDVRFWNELYGKTDEEMNGKVVAPQPDPEFKVVEEEKDDTVLVQGVAKAVGSLALGKDGDSSLVSSRNGTPIPAMSLSSSFTGSRPSSALSGLSREQSPAILPVEPSTSPASKTSPTEVRPLAGRQESFRPFNSSTSAFSLRSSPTTQPKSVPPVDSYPSPDPYVKPAANPYSSLYERPAPPPVSSRTNPNAQGYSFGSQSFSTASLADGLAGFANNAGGGMKSIWGRLSSNASAAFSAVQDATKDLRAAGPSGSGSFGGYGGSGSNEPRRESALGWGNDGWGATTSSPLTASPSTWTASQEPATIRPKPRVGTLDGNPWATSAGTKRLEDEWQTNITRPLGNSTFSQHPLEARSSVPIVAPAPRHAPNTGLPTSSTLEATPGMKPKSPPISSDPLGVGL